MYQTLYKKYSKFQKRYNKSSLRGGSEGLTLSDIINNITNNEENILNIPLITPLRTTDNTFDIGTWKNLRWELIIYKSKKDKEIILKFVVNNSYIYNVEITNIINDNVIEKCNNIIITKETLTTKEKLILYYGDDAKQYKIENTDIKITKQNEMGRYDR